MKSYLEEKGQKTIAVKLSSHGMPNASDITRMPTEVDILSCNIMFMSLVSSFSFFLTDVNMLYRLLLMYVAPEDTRQMMHGEAQQKHIMHALNCHVHVLIDNN